MLLNNPHLFKFRKFSFLFSSSTMGNFLVVCRHHKLSCFGAVATSKNRSIVQLVKIDGKIIEFSTPVLVKDVLLNFSGFSIALARENLQHLPRNSRLKLGNTYHLIPSVESSDTAEQESRKFEKEETSSVKRIKVVITRQQLQDLLSKQVLPVDILSGLKSTTSSDDGINSMSNWKPRLESIPEENELGSSIF